MGYSVYYDSTWKRFSGYGVPAICDHPNCNEEINRGLGYICVGEEEDEPCGLFFCDEHTSLDNQCENCKYLDESFVPKPETKEWIEHMLTDDSWESWRNNNPGEVECLKLTIKSNK